jgi:hypothetical protein
VKLSETQSRLDTIHHQIIYLRQTPQDHGFENFGHWHRRAFLERKTVDDVVGLRASLYSPHLDLPIGNGVSPSQSIEELANFIEAQGARFIYVCLPFEPELEPDDFFSKPHPYIHPPRQSWLLSLSLMGIECYDAGRWLTEVPSHQRLTLPGPDPHLTPNAILTIATRIVGLIEQQIPAVTNPEFRTIPTQLTLTETFQIGDNLDSLQLDYDRYELPNGTPLPEHGGSELLLIGDSNSEYWEDLLGKNAGLGSAISSRLGIGISKLTGSGFQPYYINRVDSSYFKDRKVVVYVQTPSLIYRRGQPHFPIKFTPIK